MASQSELMRAAETPHILAIGLPFHGHMSPMLQLSNRLASNGLKVTLALLSQTHKITKSPNTSINLQFISNEKETPADHYNYFNHTISAKLPDIIKQHSQSGYPVSCLVYDSLLHGVLDIAKNLGLAAAPLFTMSCSVIKILFSAYEGKLNVPVEQTPVVIEGLPPLGLYDLPSFFFDSVTYPGNLSFLTNQFLNVSQADWVFFNTFTTLENQVLKSMEKHCKVTPIGPTIPSEYIDKRIQNNKEYGLSLFKPETERCKKWLDSKENGSVVYVSYGSMMAMSNKQMEEIASGLKNSNHDFLWAVRESEIEKLPKNFVDETSEKGLVVSWCHQLEVLSHSSVGCFVSHCGWNSTMEALCMGVPVVAMPQAYDQTANAAFIADVWGVGVRVKKDEEEGIVTKQEIEMCIREVMEADKGKEIRKNSEKWKMLAKEAIDEGGSSDRNILEFVEKLKLVY